MRRTAILRTQEELMVDLAQVRTRLGQAAPDEVSALTTQAELTRAGAARRCTSQLRQTEHLLAVLAGRASLHRACLPFTLAGFTLARATAR
jgi:hypothetical protein